MRLAAGQSLTLSDGNANNGAALYVDQLLLEGGLGQIANLTGNGFRIYYNPYDPANAYLAADTYVLTGGGAIIPVLINLRITSITRLSNGRIVLQCLGAHGRTHTVQAAPDLAATFVGIGTVTAAADGTFTFEDANAGSFPRRFYRLVFP